MSDDKILNRNWDDFWSTGYRTIDFELQCNLNSHQGRITFDLLKECKDGARILEAGCGMGNWVFILDKMGFRPFGIDLSLASLRVAKGYSCKNNLKSDFILSDVRKIPFQDNCFDAVISYGVIEHFLNSQDALKEFYRVLKPGGVCLITTPNPFSFHRLIGRHILNFTKSCKLGYVGYEKAFTPYGLAHLLKIGGFDMIKYGILSEGMGTLFGVFWPAIPLIGKTLNNFFEKLSNYIENRQNLVGGGSYAIGYKN